MTEMPQHSEFNLPGVRCGGCIAAIEEGLAHVPGVLGARVNLTTKRVGIDHDARLDAAALREAIGVIGFAAEPILLSEHGTDHTESRRLLMALGVAGFAAMNIMLLSVSIWSGAEGATRQLFHWLSALIAMPTVAYAGQPFFRSAWEALRRGRTNMDVPISIGVLLATSLSLFETMTGGHQAYFDGAVSLLFFLLVGRFLDSAMRERARDGASALLRQTAPGGTIEYANGSRERLASTQMTAGMALLVSAGERFAADGVIESGVSMVDRSLVTGESRPEAIAEGSKVIAGSLNLGNPVRVRISAAGLDTAIAGMARLMEAASQGRSRYVRVADRAASYYAPAVHILAALSFVGWLVAGAGWHQSMLIAVAVLIITCPCALGLAVPVAQVVASAAMMRRGLLVKDGSALERLAEADRACFDKTGTLTMGQAELVDCPRLDMSEKSMVLALARASTHPLARALVRYLDEQGIFPAPVHDVAEVSGMGMEARYKGSMIRLGRPAWLGLSDGSAAMSCAFAMDGENPRLFRFEDALRPDAGMTIAAFAKMGFQPMILSGDRREAVLPIARDLNMSAAVEMTPEAKLATVQRLMQRGSHVLMVGDGLNDGPALAAGHVSMAPSSASDVGQNAADIVFLGDSIAPVAIAVRAARRTMRVVRQNFALAVGYNILAVPLALSGMVTPLIAAISMSTSSIIVVANALRLNRCAR
jgi:Cu2+-exporting ATPase